MKFSASAAGGQAGLADVAAAANAGRGPTRTVGATVILVDGALAAHLARGDRQLTSFLPDAEPDRSKAARAIARVLIDRARAVDAVSETPRGMLLEEIDGAPPSLHPIAHYLTEAGFISGAMGFAIQSTAMSPGRVVVTLDQHA